MSNQKWEIYIEPKDEVLIGGLIFLNNWIIRGEKSNALGKLLIKNNQTGIEEELKFTDEKVIVPGISLIQRDKNTDLIYLYYSSPKTPSKTYLYNFC